MLGVTEQDLVKLEPLLSTNLNFKTPNMKISVYKNRRGSYTGVYLWCHANLSTCRIHPQFVTNWHGDLVSIEDIKVIVEQPAAWEK